MLDLLYKRRSIRKFLETPVDPEIVDRLVQGVLLAPSAHNLKPWEFVVVYKKTLIQGLSRAKEKGSLFLADCPLVIVVLAKPEISDVWIEDTAIAATICHVLAENLGLGSCWVQIRNRKNASGEASSDYVRSLLGIPETCEVEAMIAVGYKAETRPERSRDSLPFNKVHLNSYGKQYTPWEG